MDPRHRRLTEIALTAGGDHGLALAGGYAIRAHGMGDRPSDDVDLFTDWQRRVDFPAVVDLVIEALLREGYAVSVGKREATFARLLITEGADGEPQKMELAADWRAHPPVVLDVGPVLHPDDAVANKMSALYGRALARDFLDVEAIIASGRYTPQQLLILGKSADAGFELEMFTHSLASLDRIDDEASTATGPTGPPSGRCGRGLRGGGGSLPRAEQARQVVAREFTLRVEKDRLRPT